MAIKLRVSLLIILLLSWGWMRFYAPSSDERAVEVKETYSQELADNTVSVQVISAQDLEKLQQYDLELQQALSQEQTLEEAIALVKSKQKKIYGEQADAQFSEQNKSLDYALYIQHLAERALLNGLSNEQALAQLLLKAEGELSDIQTYAYAQKLYALLGVNITPAVNASLAEKLLSGDELENIRAHEALKQVQNERKSAYKTAYSQLISSMQGERLASKSQLSEQEWQHYKSKRISDFKRDFYQ